MIFFCSCIFSKQTMIKYVDLDHVNFLSWVMCTDDWICSGDYFWLPTHFYQLRISLILDAISACFHYGPCYFSGLASSLYISWSCWRIWVSQPVVHKLVLLNSCIKCVCDLRASFLFVWLICFPYLFMDTVLGIMPLLLGVTKCYNDFRLAFWWTSVFQYSQLARGSRLPTPCGWPLICWNDQDIGMSSICLLFHS